MKQVIAVLLIIAAGQFIYSFFTEDKNDELVMSEPFPQTTSITNQAILSCDALMASSATGSSQEYLGNNIEFKMYDGTDTVSLYVTAEGELSVLTGASMSAGVTTGDKFVIVKNDHKTLIAADQKADYITTIVLNKKNGLGIWTKSMPDFLSSEGPYGHLTYLKCL